MKKSKGYTLIEILIYTVIVSLYLFLVAQLFISIKTANANSIALGALQKNSRQIVADLTSTLRNAQTVNTPAAGQTTTVLSLNNGAISYQLQNGILQKTENGQTWDLTTPEVTLANLSFQNPVEATQTASLHLTLTIESNYLLEGGRQLSEDLVTTITLR